MKKRIIALILAIYTITGLGVNKENKKAKTEDIKKLLQSEDAEESYFRLWYNALKESKFSDREKEILQKKFLPYLLENFDLYNPEALANLLSATENTSVRYVQGYRSEAMEASYNNIICKFPFAGCFTDGIITLDETYTDDEFLHEFTHSTQGWNGQDYIYHETYANFCADGNYDDLYAIFTMLGYLGDKESLHKSLINGTMDEYWSYLAVLYEDEKMIEELREDIENTFVCTYKSGGALRYKPFQDKLRSDVLERIKALYSIKYNTKIEDDVLFQVLISMYNLDDRYIRVNNPLLDDVLIYKFKDGFNIYDYAIDESNRFLSSKNY